MILPTIRTVPISDLLDLKFIIPAYQRGYRWTGQQVRDLLEDISAFQQKPNGKFYCLQPLVVKRGGGATADRWEVVDGQQRLTTILLILINLKDIVKTLGKRPFDLQFKTRPNSAAFIANLNSENGVDPNIAEANIDYYHIWIAYQTIDKWFRDKRPDGTSKLSFLQCLLSPDADGNANNKNVRVIWYELPEHDEPTKAFARLNIGKISLEDSELVRAMFLRRGNIEDEATRFRQMQIAQEWDIVEKALQSDDLWYFLHRDTGESRPRIEFILELMATEAGVAPSDCDRHTTFRYFSGKLTEPGNISKEWLAVKSTFMSLEQWFNDRALFHIVGYLVHTGQNVIELRRLAKNQNKKKLEELLRNRIYHGITGGNIPGDKKGLSEAIASNVRDLQYDGTSANGNRAIKSFLLLFNIATLLANARSNIRFPFDSYATQNWDIEHIHAIKDGIPKRPDDQKKWLGLIWNYWEHTAVINENEQSLRETAQSLSKKLDSQPLQESEFVGFYNDVLDFFNGNEQDVGYEEYPENGIGNLTLLDSSTNRAYKNHLFPVKRRWVLGLDKGGTFVPLCTRNVFLKCYSNTPGNPVVWTSGDRHGYRNAIIDTLKDFFAQPIGMDGCANGNY